MKIHYETVLYTFRHDSSADSHTEPESLNLGLFLSQLAVALLSSYTNGMDSLWVLTFRFLFSGPPVPEFHPNDILQSQTKPDLPIFLSHPQVPT
jgi:hypothetical protein